jgi:hypothetical protein
MLFFAGLAWGKEKTNFSLCFIVALYLFFCFILSSEFQSCHVSMYVSAFPLRKFLLPFH